MSTTPRLKTKYNDEIRGALKERLGLSNVMQVPRFDKIVVNMGVGRATQQPSLLEAAVTDMTAITGQKPAICVAKKSVANFRLREGAKIGCKATLRGARMWEFLDKLVNVTLPRVRDFQGVNPNSFDGRGNFAMGMKEQLTFPEISYDQIDKIRGMDIIMVTTAGKDEEARYLLHQLGMPFRSSANAGPGGATRLEL